MSLTLLSAATAANGKPEAKATGTVTCVAKTNFADTDYCTIGDSTTRVTCVTKANLTAGDYFSIATMKKKVVFQLDKTGSDTHVATANTIIDVSSATTAADVAALVVTAINAEQDFNVTATDLTDGRFIVELTTYDPLDFVTVTENVSNAGFSTGLRSEVFEFDTAGDGVTTGRVQVNISAQTTAAQCATVLAAAINGLTAFRITALDNADGTLTLTRTNFHKAGNVTITENVSNASFTVSGLTGGVKTVAGVTLAHDWHRKDRGVISVWSSAGYGTMTCTLRLWGKDPTSGRWMPVGVGTASGKGVLNDGNAIEESSANQIVHAETVEGLSAFTAVYLEITAIGGTSTAINAVLTAREDN